MKSFIKIVCVSDCIHTTTNGIYEVISKVYYILKWVDQPIDTLSAEKYSYF